MKTIFGEEVMNTADSAAMQRLEQLADQFELNGGNNAGEYTASMCFPDDPATACDLSMSVTDFRSVVGESR